MVPNPDTISPAASLHLNGTTGSVRTGSPYFLRIPYTSLKRVLKEMQKLITQFSGDPRIRDLVFRVTTGLSADPRSGLPNMRNFDGVAQTIYRWINTHIRYVRDPVDIEWLQSPIVTLQKGMGDCDDLSILAASMLRSVGITTQFVLVKADPRYKNIYSHIYLEYQNGIGQWIPFDMTMHSRTGVALGENRIFGKKKISISDTPNSMTMSKTDLGSIDLTTIGKEITGALGFPKVTGATAPVNNAAGWQNVIDTLSSALGGQKASTTSLPVVTSSPGTVPAATTTTSGVSTGKIILVVGTMAVAAVATLIIIKERNKKRVS